MTDPADAPAASSQKKKRRRSEGLDEPPPVVDSPDEMKKKKRRREGHEDMEKISLPPAEEDMNIKKRKEEERIVMVTLDDNVSTEEKKKKKKRKEAQNEEERTEVEPPPVVSSPVETKKKKKRKEESITMATTDNSDVSTQKKKKQEEEDCAFTETFQSEEKKKKKQKNGLMEPSITMVTTAKNMDREPLVPMDTSKKKKKKKKKKEEDLVTVGTTETEVRSITMVTTNNHTQSEQRKKNQVTIATTQKKLRQKNRNQNQEDGQMETGDAWSQAQLQELKEYIPNLSRRSSSVIRKLLLYDLTRFREFKKKGVALRWGRFSKEENHQIQVNINNFLLLTGIGSVEELMFPQRFKDKEAEIKTLRKNHHYIWRIAEGIPRPSLQILVRAKKMMDSRNHMGRFTEDEVHTLTKLHTLHGNDWKMIAEKMNRSTAAVLKRFATTGGGKGPWSADEASRLKGAIEDHLKIRLQKSAPGSGLSRQQLCVNLPWMKISLAVGSRTWYQCRLKWFSILKQRLEGQRSTSWFGIQNRINIVDTLFNMDVKDQRDVDWMNVAKAVGAVTPVYVQKAFSRMKSTRVPNWDRLSYGEIVDVLMEREVPRLQMMLDKLENQNKQTQDALDLQDSYQLSDIFPESHELSGDELSGDELSQAV